VWQNPRWRLSLMGRGVSQAADHRLGPVPIPLVVGLMRGAVTELQALDPASQLLGPLWTVVGAGARASTPTRESIISSALATGRAGDASAVGEMEGVRSCNWDVGQGAERLLVLVVRDEVQLGHLLREQIPV
jgi:hypothetical protein